MVFGSLMMLLFWVALVAAVVLVVRWSVHRRDPVGTTSRAAAILEERFARGEIDKEEFEERRRSLSN